MKTAEIEKHLKANRFEEAAALVLDTKTRKPEDLNKLLRLTASKPALALAQLLIELGADVNALSPQRSYTPLFIATFHNNLAMATLLLDNGALVDQLGDADGRPLTHAAFHGYEELARLLLARGADVALASVKVRRSPLHLAALGGHDALVTLLLAHGADLGLRDIEGSTPLGLAAWKGHLSTTKLLLAAGADPNDPPGASYRTPLHLAATHEEVCELLMAHGASAAVRDRHGCSPICSAAESGSLAFIERLAAAGASLLCFNERQHQTALHHAARRGDVALLKYLLAAGGTLDRPNAERQTPLHLAVRYLIDNPTADYALLTMLLHAGADPNLPVMHDEQLTYGYPPPPKTPVVSWRPFPAAVAAERWLLAALLHEYGADVNAASVAPKQRLHTAFDAVVDQLIKAIDAAAAERDDDAPAPSAAGPDRLDWLLAIGATVPPGLLARLFRHDGDEEYFPLFQRLIAAGADVKAPNLLGLAVADGNEPLVRFLVAAGAPIDVPYQALSTLVYPTTLAQAITTAPPMVALLVELGADITRMVPGPDGAPCTYAALARAKAEKAQRPICFQNVELVESRLVAALEPGSPAYLDAVTEACVERIRLGADPDWARWLERGADPNALDTTGLLPIAHLLARGDLAGAERLMAHGADINRVDRFGRTPLHWAAEHGQLEAALQALAWGAAINAATPYGYTALHYAALSGALALAERLLEAGAAPAPVLSAGRLNGWTPLHFAYAIEHLDLMLLLDPLTPRITAPAANAQRFSGEYTIIRAYSTWHKPHPISPQARRCLHCGENMVYNTAHTYDGSGQLADRIEIHDCANCNQRFWENGMGAGPKPLQPWATFVQS